MWRSEAVHLTCLKTAVPVWQVRATLTCHICPTTKSRPVWRIDDTYIEIGPRFGYGPPPEASPFPYQAYSRAAASGHTTQTGAGIRRDTPVTISGELHLSAECLKAQEQDK